MNLSAVGLRIKTARENAHMTQEQFAASMGCTTQHISAIERGVKTPKLGTFVQMANTLGVSADELLQDVLECPADLLAEKISAAVAPLPKKLQLRIVKVIRILSEEESSPDYDCGGR